MFVLYLACVLLLVPRVSHAQESEPLEQELEIRVGANAEREIVDDLDGDIEIETRTDGFDPDRYLLEPSLDYKPIDYFSAKASFRTDIEEKSDGIDHGYRPRFAVEGHLPFSDFELEARLQYTHAFGPQRDLDRRLRYRGGLGWDVPKAKMDWKISAEAFQDVATWEFYKMRYSIDTKFRFFGSKGFDQWLSVGYMLDYYLDRPRNRHMPVLKYTAEFE